jgi:hypothetical protein
MNRALPAPRGAGSRYVNLSPTDELELAKRMERGDDDAKATLVDRCYSDTLSKELLLYAVCTFDWRRGHRLSTHVRRMAWKVGFSPYLRRPSLPSRQGHRQPRRRHCRTTRSCRTGTRGSPSRSSDGDPEPAPAVAGIHTGGAR